MRDCYVIECWPKKRQHKENMSLDSERLMTNGLRVLEKTFSAPTLAGAPGLRRRAFGGATQTLGSQIPCRAIRPGAEGPDLRGHAGPATVVLPEHGGRPFDLSTRIGRSQEAPCPEKGNAEASPLYLARCR